MTRVAKSVHIESVVSEQYRKSAVKMLTPQLDDRQRWWETYSDAWFVRNQKQEDELLAQGHDVAGLTEWAKAWLIAWNDLDHDAADACVTPDVNWEDPTMYGEKVENRDDFRTYCGQFWHALPDLQFYPSDQGWIDVDVDGNVRICVPWQAIGTFTETFRMWPVTRTSPVLAPSGGACDFEGVDRYNMVRSDDGPGGWQIRYGKTVYDLLSVMNQVGMIPALTSQKARPVLLGFNTLARTVNIGRKLGLVT